MDRTLVDFVKVLRTAEIKVSPAETLDAMECMDLVGYENREFLKNSLALVLAKNPEEKEAFEDCFERFFVMDKPAQPGNTSSSEDESGGEDEFDDGDFNAEGESQQSGKGGGQGGGG